MTYMTTDDLAERLRTSPSTVRYWRSIGRGPRSIKIGRRILYEVKEVERWLERETRRQTDPRDAA